jgi:hypothetical protein
MSTLGEIRRTNEGPTRDLWPRVRERLTAEDRVRFRMPALTWPVVVASAIAAGMLIVTPEPARLLAACGLL